MGHVLRAVAAIILLGTVISCATEGNYRTTLKTWEGVEATRLVEVWGAPQAILEIGRGESAWIYTRAGPVVSIPRKARHNYLYAGGELSRLTRGVGEVTEFYSVTLPGGWEPS